MTQEPHGPVADWADRQRAGLEQWYRETRDELLDVGEHPRGLEQRHGENDHLIQRTNNGLRPGDPAEQPPQDPAWRPA